MSAFKRFSIFFITISLCLALVLPLYFAKSVVPAIPEAQGVIEQSNYLVDDEGNYYVENIKSVIGEDITAVRIDDLVDLGTITKVNYIPDVFAKPLDFSNSQIVDLSKDFDFSKRGTLFFVVLNLDPMDENFMQKSENLEKYKVGDNWKFSISIPQVFSACNVYQNSSLVQSHGEIENYDFIEFNTSYDKVSQSHLSSTEKTDISLSFYTNRNAMGTIYASNIITIHYEGDGSIFDGVKSFAHIGTNEQIKGVERQYNAYLLIAILLSFMVFAVLFVLSILKKTGLFVGELTSISAIILLFISKYYLYTSTTIPLLLNALGGLAFFILLAGGSYFICKRFKHKAYLFSLLGVCLVGGVLAIILPYIPVTSASALKVAILSFKLGISVVLLAFTVYALLKDLTAPTNLSIICACLLCAFTISTLFIKDLGNIASYSPIWICLAFLVFSFATTFKIFAKTEKENEYLTHNLNLEVTRQTQEANSIILERDKLLQFVSHDMKKPLSNSLSLLDTLASREKDGEQIKIMNIVKQNTQKVVSNLTEISSYAKYNYVAEVSSAINLKDLCALIYKYSRADCEAVGITLTNLATTNFRVFAKKQGLENAVTNIIFNAIEHADCSKIELTTESHKNKVLLKVTDNGKGVNKDIDVFSPYVSENVSDGDGLGLYICKNIIESMNGELYFTSEAGKTSFIISLLKA